MEIVNFSYGNRFLWSFIASVRTVMPLLLSSEGSAPALSRMGSLSYLCTNATPYSKGSRAKFKHPTNSHLRLCKECFQFYYTYRDNQAGTDGNTSCGICLFLFWEQILVVIHGQHVRSHAAVV